MKKYPTRNDKRSRLSHEWCSYYIEDSYTLAPVVFDSKLVEIQNKRRILKQPVAKSGFRRGQRGK